MTDIASPQEFRDAFLEAGALQWRWWLDEEVIEVPEFVGYDGETRVGWRLTGGLWGGSDDWSDSWQDFVGDEANQSFEFEIDSDDIQAALVYAAGVADDASRRLALGLTVDAVFEACKWVAGEWADCDFDADTADQVLQIAVQLSCGVKRPVVLYA